jgi:hypothetical protein
MPGTVLLFNTLDYGMASGFRVAAGYGSPDGSWGLEGTFFALEKRSDDFHATSDAAGNPVLVRPATNALDGRPTGEVVAFPGAFSGQMAIHSESTFWGADAYFVCPIYCDCCHTMNAELLAGFVYLDLREDLTVGQITNILPGGVSGFDGGFLFAPTTLGIADHFGTRNQFWGGEVGGQGETMFNNFFLNASFKLGIGVTHEVANIEGFTRETAANGTSVTVPGGVSALPNNIGHNTRNEFALMPEVTVNFGVELTKWARVWIGYTFLYWTDVIRPGDEVNTPVNPAQVPTSLTFGAVQPAPSRPIPVFTRTDFWAQGLNVGVAFRY